MLRKHVITVFVALLAMLFSSCGVDDKPAAQQIATQSSTTQPTRSTDAPSNSSPNNAAPTSAPNDTTKLDDATKPLSVEQKLFLPPTWNENEPNVDIPATPPPSPTPAPASTTSLPSTATAPGTTECGPYYSLVASYFPASQVPKACAVMGCETGYTYDPTIHNPRSTASGLFQFLDSTWESTTGTPAPAANYPAETQIRAAATLYSQQGWSPWVCA